MSRLHTYCVTGGRVLSPKAMVLWQLCSSVSWSFIPSRAPPLIAGPPFLGRLHRHTEPDMLGVPMERLIVALSSPLSDCEVPFA